MIRWPVVPFTFPSQPWLSHIVFPPFQIVLRLDRKNIHLLRGFAHQHDTLQNAIMHKTSQPKFTIPYNDPRYKSTPNAYTFVIKPSTWTEFSDTDCRLDTSPDTDNVDCFAEHLQKMLGCTLPWDVGRNSGQKNPSQVPKASYKFPQIKNTPGHVLDCPRCQVPFSWNGKTYSECTGDNAAANHTWCPTATFSNASTVPDSWQFCYPGCNHGNSGTNA